MALGASTSSNIFANQCAFFGGRVSAGTGTATGKREFSLQSIEFFFDQKSGHSGSL